MRTDSRPRIDIDLADVAAALREDVALRQTTEVVATPSGGLHIALATAEPVPPRVLYLKDRRRLGEWLTQWIVRPDITLHALIRSTANEEVAHTEEERGELLAKLAGSGVMVISKEDLEAGRLDEARVVQETYQMAIVGIGEYVVQRVRELLAEA